MASKKIKKDSSAVTPTKFVLKGSRDYSLYVAMLRAIPHVGDGFKPSQRIALWLLRNKAEKMKTVGLGGLMASERLYVHGDASANDAIGKLAAPYKNNVPLITGIGSFGSRTKPVDGIGAPRYTDVKRSKAAEAFVYNDLPIVPLMENYDGSNLMPVNFLPLIPTVLLNGISGVAVGYSTDILPRRLSDLIKATQDALMGKRFKEPAPFYERYDLDIGNIGQSQWQITGKAEVKDTSTILVTELPVGLGLEQFKKRLIGMEDEDKIVNFLDNSSESILIEVQMKRGSVKGWTSQQAIDFLKLSEKVTERIVVVSWDSDRIITYDSAVDLIKDFAKWRLGFYEKRYQKYHDDDSFELQYWKLLKALFAGGFTKKLGTFADRAAVEAETLRIATAKKIKPDESHVDRAVSLPTYRWTKQFEAEVDKKIAELTERIKSHKAILASPERRKEIYFDELEQLKKIKL